MTATTALAYLQLQPNLRTGEQMTFHLIGECGRFGLWPFWTYTLYASLPYHAGVVGVRTPPPDFSQGSQAVRQLPHSRLQFVIYHYV